MKGWNAARKNCIGPGTKPGCAETSQRHRDNGGAKVKMPVEGDAVADWCATVDIYADRWTHRMTRRGMELMNCNAHSGEPGRGSKAAWKTRHWINVRLVSNQHRIGSPLPQ